MTTADVHFFSQLVYLNVPSQKGRIMTVDDLAYFYLHTQAGQRLLEKRFENTPKEYELWKEMLENIPPGLGSWQITDILDDNAPHQTGFYGCTYRSPQGERVVAFRGSEMLGNPSFKNDYVTDFSLILCDKTPQQAMVDRYWEQYAGQPGPVWITGHSLGGNLAAYAAMAAPDHLLPQIQEVLTFNAPGFCQEFLQQYQQPVKELGDQLRLYQNRYDIVSSLLDHPVQPRITGSLFDPTEPEEPTIGDVMYPHSNFMFQTDEQGEPILDPDQNKSPLCDLIHKLSDLLLSLPVPLRQELITLTLDSIYDAPDGSSGRKAALEAASRFLSQHLAHAGAQNSAIVAYGAGLIQQQNPAALLAKLHRTAPMAGALPSALILLLNILRP